MYFKETLYPVFFQCIFIIRDSFKEDFFVWLNFWNAFRNCCWGLFYHWCWVVCILVTYERPSLVFLRGWQVLRVKSQRTSRKSAYSDYSNQNTAIQFKDEYKILLISKVETVLKRMESKVLQFLGKLEDITMETCLFKSRKIPTKPLLKQIKLVIRKSWRRKVGGMIITNFWNRSLKKLLRDHYKDHYSKVDTKTCGKIIDK